MSAVTDPLFSRDEYLHLKTILPLKHKHGQTHTVVQERSYSDKMKKKISTKYDDDDDDELLAVVVAS